jgi:amino acid permease
LIVAPLSCLQSLDALKYTSSLSVIFILFLVFIILLFALPSLTGLNPCLDYGVNEICKGETEYSRLDSGSLKALSVFVFGYTCQQNLFSIINELKSPTQERVDLVIVSSIGSAFVLFMIVGYCGYSTYGNNVASDLLKSYPEIPLTTAARICVSFIVSFAYPLQANPSRRSLLTLWRTACGGGEPSILNYNLRYYTITITFLITSLFIAITVHDLGIVLAFVGATGSTIVSYILPGIFYYKIFRNDELEPKWKTKLSLLQFTLGLIIIPVCLYFLIFVQ